MRLESYLLKVSVAIYLTIKIHRSTRFIVLLEGPKQMVNKWRQCKSRSVFTIQDRSAIGGRTFLKFLEA